MINQGFLICQIVKLGIGKAHLLSLLKGLRFVQEHAEEQGCHRYYCPVCGKYLTHDDELADEFLRGIEVAWPDFENPVNDYEREREYIENEGKTCPKCGSKEIYGHAIKDEGFIAVQERECECGYEWNAVYELARISQNQRSCS